MTNEANVEKFWNEFRMTRPEIGPATEYQVWYFGDSRETADELAELALTGVKTATASSVSADALEPEKAAVADGYSVVTDFDGSPVCMVRTTQVRYIPFDDVDAEFAFDEGEGDRTLETWRRVHWEYFTREAARHGFDFDGRSLVCCERFKLLFP